MAFIDEAKITVHAGRGGNGCISFRREKFVPKGGPNGGSGGTGGSVIFQASRDKQSLLDFKFRPKYEAKKGEHGMGQDCDGRGGDDLVLLVPLGTRVFDAKTQTLIVDLKEDGQTQTIAKGGKGGIGNMHFKTSTVRAPRIATPGGAGQSLALWLELRMLADVGIVGLPNAGKSSLLRTISNARPKVADYPFTTLEPHLGVVNSKGGSFIAADIPGLIEGASQGAGLGHRYLKHAMRNRVLLHLVDCSHTTRDIVKAIKTIREELYAFDSTLKEREEILVFSKSDLLSPAEKSTKKLKLKEKGIAGIFISSQTHEGISQLLDHVGQRLGQRLDQRLQI